TGTLYLTGTHLIFVETSCNTRKETWVLHHLIATVEKLPLTATGCPLHISCKNFHNVYQSLLKLSQPGTYSSRSTLL
uniref:MTMR6-9 GRAM domain-containing protein n=1 Tax=Oncorhynchus mykiss TaxID=8022 RepID=A0A8C7UWB2_ONCMY